MSVPLFRSFLRAGIDDGNDEHATLYAMTPSKEHRLLSRINDGPDVAGLSRKVAEITGWHLRIDADVDPD